MGCDSSCLKRIPARIASSRGFCAKILRICAGRHIRYFAGNPMRASPVRNALSPVECPALAIHVGHPASHFARGHKPPCHDGKNGGRRSSSGGPVFIRRKPETSGKLRIDPFQGAVGSTLARRKPLPGRSCEPCRTKLRYSYRSVSDRGAMLAAGIISALGQTAVVKAPRSRLPSIE